MMGIDPIAAYSLSFWKFTALRWGWNERHKVEGAEVAAPTSDKVERMFAKTRLN